MVRDVWHDSQRPGISGAFVGTANKIRQRAFVVQTGPLSPEADSSKMLSVYRNPTVASVAGPNISYRAFAVQTGPPSPDGVSPEHTPTTWPRLTLSTIDGVDHVAGRRPLTCSRPAKASIRMTRVMSAQRAPPVPAHPLLRAAYGLPATRGDHRGEHPRYGRRLGHRLNDISFPSFAARPQLQPQSRGSPCP